MYTVDSMLVYTLIFIGCTLSCTIILIICLVVLGYTMQWVFELLQILPEPLPHPTLTPMQKVLAQAWKRDGKGYLRTEGGRLLEVTSDAEHGTEVTTS